MQLCWAWSRALQGGVWRQGGDSEHFGFAAAEGAVVWCGWVVVVGMGVAPI